MFKCFGNFQKNFFAKIASVASSKQLYTTKRLEYRL
jgi:hypothetical protein